MDSIKIIKKHGQPGGLPVVTVYVDEEAPGETKALYEHIICTGSIAVMAIITESGTAFTADSLADLLVASGFDSASNALPLWGVSGLSARTDGFSLRTYYSVYANATGSNRLRLRTNAQTVSLAEGVWTVQSPVASTGDFTSFNDKIIPMRS